MKRTTSAFQRLAVFSVSIIFILSALLGLYQCIFRPPEVPGNSLSSVVPGNADPSGVGQNTVEGRKESFYTILVGGLDDENGGSDTNLLVAMDAKNHTVNVLSLPRDTLLNVSWTVKKLNNAYHYGGFERTCTEVSNLLGIPVDFYVTVSLNAFVELVDAIDGVDFEVPVNMDYDDPYQNLSIHFQAGMQHLNGEDALKVVRWRQNNDGSAYPTADIGRIGTQQAFLKAAIRQLLQPSNLDKLPSLAEIVHQNVNTDLKASNLLWLGEQALLCGSEGISFYTLPGDGAGWYNGGSYYVVDDAATLELVNRCFNPYTQDITREDMDILVP